MKKGLKIVGLILGGILVLSVIGAIVSPTPTEVHVPADKPTPSATQTVAKNDDALKKQAMKRVKEQLETLFPNDYITQSSLMDEHSKAYDYMAKIADSDPVKKEVISTFPDDYIVQKSLYEEQMKAKKRLE